MVNPEHTFHVADYIIFAVTIAVSLGIGLYYALSGGKQRTTSEYLVGNRRMAVLPVAISLMVSFESSIMMLGVPAEVYVYGFQWLIGNIGFLIANILAIKVLVPIIHPLKITSAYEYLELRFKSRAVRIFGTILGMLSYTCYMGIVLFGPAIALEAVTGFPQWASIVSVAGAAVIYTAIGGLKAVIWTDVFQCFVMFAGFFAVLIKGTIQIGGIGRTWEIANEKGRLNMFNFDPDPTLRHSFWCLFVGSIMRGFGLLFNQSSIQRISSTPTVRDANKVLLLTAPGFFLSLTLAGVEGIIAYAYYDTIGCDPIKSKQIANPNQLIPYMVMDIFKGVQGMPGLFMASLFAASLSTLSSGLSSMSALMWTDLVKPHVKPMSEFKATVIAKLSVVVFGGLAVFVAFMIAMIGGTLIQIAGSILSAFGGPLTGLFMFGAFCPWATSKGALGGGVLSVIITFVIAIGQMTTKGSVKNARLPSAPIDMCPVLNSTSSMVFNMTTELIGGVTDMMTSTEMPEPTGYPEPTGFRRVFMLSYQWFGVVGIMGVIVFGTIITFLTGRADPKEVDTRYLVPMYDKLFCCLPECIRKVLRCGVVYDKDDQYENVVQKEDVLHMDIVIDSPLENGLKSGDTNGDIQQHLHIKTSIGDLHLPQLPVTNREYIITTADDIAPKDMDTQKLSDIDIPVVLETESRGPVIIYKDNDIDILIGLISSSDQQSTDVIEGRQTEKANTDSPQVEDVHPSDEQEGVEKEPSTNATEETIEESKDVADVEPAEAVVEDADKNTRM